MIVEDYLQNYQVCIPSYKSVKNFMEHSVSDDTDLSEQLDTNIHLNNNGSEDKALGSTLSPPNNKRDLVELLSV